MIERLSEESLNAYCSADELTIIQTMSPASQQADRTMPGPVTLSVDDIATQGTCSLEQGVAFVPGGPAHPIIIPDDYDGTRKTDSFFSMRQDFSVLNRMSDQEDFEDLSSHSVGRGNSTVGSIDAIPSARTPSVSEAGTSTLQYLTLFSDTGYEQQPSRTVSALPIDTNRISCLPPKLSRWRPVDRPPSRDVVAMDLEKHLRPSPCTRNHSEDAKSNNPVASSTSGDSTDEADGSDMDSSITVTILIPVLLIRHIHGAVLAGDILI